MKISGAKKIHYDSGPNMTPLVDVVMVILIFLMLAGSFGLAEHFMASKTPIRQQGAPSPEVEPEDKPQTTFEVTIRDNGDFQLSGVSDGRSLRVMTDPEELKRNLEAKVAEHGSSKDVEIVLRPGLNTRWDNIAPLYDACLRAKCEKVAFAMTGSR